MSSAWEVQLQSLQTQVKTIDALETLSAAYHADGWLGGLDGVSRILACYPNASLEPLERLRHAACPPTSPVTCSIATSEGLRPCVIEDAEYAFGGSPCSQLIGLTICALGYECEGQNAVEMFIDVLGSCLFQDLDDVKLAIYNQLSQNYVRILNEGAARGLTGRFIKTIADLNILDGDRKWLRKNLLGHSDHRHQPSEVAMLGGFLKWMAQGEKSAYLTRSGLLVRVAACLREVGYRIGQIKVWIGIGNGVLSPDDRDVIPVLLILDESGALETLSIPVDPLALDRSEIVAGSYKLHYDYHTVGSMLLAALNYQSDVKAEVYQAMFEQIYDYFESYLRVEYELSKDPLSPLQITASWHKPGIAPDDLDIPMHLATIYFPTSAECVARFYRQIATQEVLEEITENLPTFGRFDDTFSENVSMFLAITASIVISFASRLAPKNFKTIRHCAFDELGMAH
ncbi:MAG: hypothetical protein M1816_002286 [Peltula sp. TS41687]|nr:MAG: hypothetical protein M1816_002286 [Peltula sp. TS41687]